MHIYYDVVYNTHSWTGQAWLEGRNNKALWKIYINAHTKNFIYYITVSYTLICNVTYNLNILNVCSGTQYYTLTFLATHAGIHNTTLGEFDPPLLQEQRGHGALYGIHLGFQHFSGESHHLCRLKSRLEIRLNY